VRVHLSGVASFAYGDVLALEGKIYRPFLSRRDAEVIMSVKHPAYVLVLARNGGSALKKSLLRIKDSIQALFSQYNPPVAAAVLEAMILGEKKNIPPALYRQMMQSGTVHILVVSGFNTGLVIFVVVLLLKMGYCIMTGASTPVVRATVMAAVFMFSYLFRRQPDIFNSCALSALCVLSYDPTQLFDIGAQLSFISVLAIVWFYPKMKTFLRLDTRLNPAARFFSEGFLVSLSAWLGTASIIAYYFKIFSPVTVLANIFIVPLATLITLCGVTFIFAAVILPPVAPFFALTCQFLVALLIKVNLLLIGLPGACFYLP
jgi:competence protein ComEC